MVRLPLAGADDFNVGTQAAVAGGTTLTPLLALCPTELTTAQSEQAAVAGFGRPASEATAGEQMQMETGRRTNTFMIK